MLRVERLTKRYGALTAIHDLSFEVARGEIIGLYVTGMFAVAYYPVQLELSQLRQGASLLVIGVCITVAVTLLDVIGRHAVRRLREPPEDRDSDLSSTTVLDISGALQGHAGR